MPDPDASAGPVALPAPLPTVSVLITAYDQERFVAAALESALAQDYPAELVDVVVVDDGSRDGTAAILAEVAARHPERVRVVRQDNAGYTAATARAVEEARGELLALLDADDAWPADKLSRQVELLVGRPEVGLVYGDMRVVDADDNVVQESWLVGEEPPQGRCRGRMLVGNSVTSSSVVLRAELARAALPFPPEIAYADWWFAVRVAEVAEVAYLPEPRTLYRFHGANMALGVTGDAKRRALRGTLAFQRHLLRRISADDATPRELGAAWNAFERFSREAIELGESPFLAPFDIDDEDRRRSRWLVRHGERALERGAVEDALVTYVRAAAEDPWNERARDGLSRALVAAVRAGRAGARAAG